MPTNDFLPFATGVGANVESQASWITDPSVPVGFSAGIASSAKANKAWRQSSFGIAALAQYLMLVLNANVNDDGNQANFLVQLWQAVLGGGYFVDIGSASAMLTANPSGVTFPAPVAGLRVSLKAAAAPTGATTFNWMGTGNKAVTFSDGSAIQANDWGASSLLDLEYDGTSWILLSVPIPSIATIVNNQFNSQFSTAPQYLTATGANSWTSTFNGYIEVHVWGGGGASCGSSAFTEAIHGAGSGGYCIHLEQVTNGQVIPYIIGAGGTPTAYGTYGNNGGSTTWNSTVVAGGGGGSGISGGITVIGNGGSASGGSVLNLIGRPGFGSSESSSPGLGGAGGSAQQGGAGGVGSEEGGSSGNQPGGGGAGPGWAANYSGKSGGNGAILIRRVA